MEKTIRRTAIAAALLSASQLASALDFAVIPSAGFQLKSLKFNQELTFPSGFQQDGELSVNLPVFQTGVTMVLDRFFVSLKYETDMVDTRGDSDIPYTNPQDPGTGVFYGTTSTQVERDDRVLSLGYSILPELSVFLGYTAGETTLTPDDEVDFSLYDSDNNGTVDTIGIYAVNAAQYHSNAGFTTYKQRYSEQGFFLGSSYTLSFENAGNLTLSAAYAQLDGEYKDNYHYLSGTGTPVNDSFAYEGDAKGLSLAATWSTPVTERLGFYADLRNQKYEMDGEDETGRFTNWSVETTETITSFAVGFRYKMM